MFSRPFRKHRVVRLTTHDRVQKKRCEYRHAKLEGSKQAEVSSRSSSRIFSRDSFLKQVKESDEKKKEAKEKGGWAQLHRVNPGLLEPGYRLMT